MLLVCPATLQHLNMRHEDDTFGTLLKENESHPGYVSLVKR